MRPRRLLVDLIAEVPVESNGDPPPVTPALNWRDEARHAKDFSNCTWFGTVHHFTPKQRLAIREMWAAWESGLPDLHQSTILAAAASEEAKLKDLFRGSTAWGVMIHPSTDFGGRVGCYRLDRQR